MQRWEYQIIDDGTGSNPDGVEELDNLGAEGWQLVAVKRQPRGNYRWYFVRPAHRRRGWQ